MNNMIFNMVMIMISMIMILLSSTDAAKPQDVSQLICTTKSAQGIVLNKGGHYDLPFNLSSVSNSTADWKWARIESLAVANALNTTANISLLILDEANYKLFSSNKTYKALASDSVPGPAHCCLDTDGPFLGQSYNFSFDQFPCSFSSAWIVIYNPTSEPFEFADVDCTTNVNDTCSAKGGVCINWTTHTVCPDDPNTGKFSIIIYTIAGVVVSAIIAGVVIFVVIRTRRTSGYASLN